MEPLVHPSLTPVDVRLGNEAHSLLLTHGAICLAEKRLGLKILDNADFWSAFGEEGKPAGIESLDSIATLLYAGLLHEGKPVNRDQLLVSIGLHNLREISDAVGAAIKAHLTPVESPIERPAAESDPTTAVVTG